MQKKLNLSRLDRTTSRLLTCDLDHCDITVRVNGIPQLELYQTSNFWLLSVHITNTTEHFSKINVSCALTV